MNFFETRISVPASDVNVIMARLARAGAVVLDTGERIATDAGPDDEACLAVCFYDAPDRPVEAAVQVSAEPAT